MKTLILIRHAKSDWTETGLSDSERPLNERGKKDAPEMAERLRKKDLKVDAFISSPAKRAFRTARFFAKAFDVDKEDIFVMPVLYGASPEVFADVINALHDKHKVVAMFAHNPGITDFANSLSSVRVDNMPTCSVYAVQADVDTWQAFLKNEKNFLFFDYPKNPLP